MRHVRPVVVIGLVALLWTAGAEGQTPTEPFERCGEKVAVHGKAMAADLEIARRVLDPELWQASSNGVRRSAYSKR